MLLTIALRKYILEKNLTKKMKDLHSKNLKLRKEIKVDTRRYKDFPCS